MSSDIVSNLEAEIEKAIKTLPPSFYGLIWDPYKKR